MASGNTPRTGFTAPFSESSPPMTQRSSECSLRTPPASSAASAIGSSNAAPSLRMSAGARFTVMRFCGSSKPAFFRAEMTRTLLSFTAPSGSPTTLK